MAKRDLWQELITPVETDDQPFQDEFAEFREQGFSDIHAVFADMEKVFADLGFREDIGLNGMQRREVQQALFAYVFDKPLLKVKIDQLRKLEKKLNETERAIRPLLDLQKLIAQDDASISLAEEQVRLKSLVQACRKILASRFYTRKRGKPLMGVMETLEEIFLELTDDDEIKTANVNWGGTRKSAFLDFARAAFRYLPAPIRPKEKALAFAWERHYLARNKT